MSDVCIPNNPNNHNINSRYNADGTRKLSIKEEIFVEEFIRTGNQQQALQVAGYKTRAPIKKDYIMAEIIRRQEIAKHESIATGDDAMLFLSQVMRGEVRDQFNLDPTLADRLRACTELLKRTKDVELQKAENDGRINISIDWNMGNEVKEVVNEAELLEVSEDET